jgi:molybdenum cofactor synthesis domain-containing protein
MEYRLLNKTEIWVGPLGLSDVNLGRCASVVARTLSLPEETVSVTDAQKGHLAFDVMSPTVGAENIIAKKEAMLSALSEVPGVSITPATDIHSDGILGLINAAPAEGADILRRSQALGREIADRISKRAMIFPTGTEVINQLIQDTNTPFLKNQLESLGFNVSTSAPLPDDVAKIFQSIRDAADDPFGLIITTGGVGAEGKDQTLEALEKLDPNASLPYVLKFKKGTGRHDKEGVRIGVGMAGSSLIVCLPGPNDEVQLMWPVLRKALVEKWEKATLADHLRRVLSEKFSHFNPHNVHYNHPQN